MPLVVDAGWFKVTVWHDLLAQAASATGVRCDAICPFGFELSGDNKWLSRPLNRFYVLVGGNIAGPPEGTRTGSLFAKHLIELLRSADSNFCERVAFVRVNRTANFRLKGPNYVATEDDALLGVLTIPDLRGALAAYADYIVSLLASSSFHHGEFVFFGEFPRARRRLIQLTYMAIWIAEGLKLPFSLPKPPGTYSFLYKTEIKDFYTRDFRKPPTPDEISFLENNAKPVFAAFRDYLHARSSANPHTFEIVDLFSGAPISATLSSEDYRTLSEFVKRTYLDYAEPPAAGFPAAR